VSIIAHLTDVHLVEPEARRPGGLTALARRGYLNMGRSVDEGGRRRSFAEALRRAATLGFDHLVVTGDLTEEGTIEQFEAVAAVLDEARIDPARVTLLPGNHDVYAHANAWADALAGPLRPYARTSASGMVVELADLVLAPVSTTRAQRWWRSAGEVSTPERRAIVQAVQTATRVHRAAWHWFDGLLDHASMRPMLRAMEHTYVLHGHLHERRDDHFEGETIAHIFGAAAVVEDPDSLRLYRVVGETVVPIEITPS
jgi:Icc protein